MSRGSAYVVQIFLRKQVTDLQRCDRCKQEWEIKNVTKGGLEDKEPQLGCV